ncbi:MAG: L-lactate permease [Peptostreptococcaceae bacterium]|nr:L-lactate permease [Peptostreptococcaceae bacterium]
MGIPLTITNWMLAILPILLLFVGILILKWSTYKTGGIVWFFTALLAFTIFKVDLPGLLYACSKGLSLSLYVLLIIWTAVFLYNVVNRAGAIDVIGNTMTELIHDRLLQSLLLAWCFTSLLQGVAGFGVPIAIVAPIMVSMGFEPLVAVATCLVGHSWAISFGSMGSSYNTIQLVTKIPGDIIGPAMALLFIVPIFITGLSVLHMQGGFNGIKKGFIPFFTTAILISFTMWSMTKLGMPQLASLTSAASGVVVLLTYARHAAKKSVALVGYDDGTYVTHNAFSHGRLEASVMISEEVENPRYRMSFLIAAMPYIILILISFLTQLPLIKVFFSGLVSGLSYPEITTGLGYVVTEEKLYAGIKWISHPAPALFISAVMGFLIYKKTAGAKPNILKMAAVDTVRKIIPTSVGIITMVMMALIMSDSGMTNLLARGLAGSMGAFFPLATPFIGILGSFLTGSNTNSNVMFGMLQYDTAIVLGKNAVWIAAAQSVGGSIGVAISPSTIMMGSANVGLTGKEHLVMAMTLRYCLIGAVALAAVVYIIS